MAAAAPDAQQLWDTPNVAIDAMVGDGSATEAAFAGAAHIARLETHVQRVTGVPMEPRTALAEFDPGTNRYTLYAGGGGVGRPKRDVAHMLGVEDAQVRVVAHDVGGNFGTRNGTYPEFALICWAARRTGRPVKWRCERGEAMLTDVQGRDLTVTAELALERSRRFPRAARLEPQQSWRLCRLLRAADQRHRADDQPLPHAGGTGAGARGVQQHGLDRALPQCRAA